MRIFYLSKRRLKLILLISLTVMALGIGYALVIACNIASTAEVAGPYYQGSTNKKMVSFTFNVDWGEEYVPSLLEILQESDIKATFFITGRWASLHPELVKSIATGGHDIGNHGQAHRHLKKLSDGELEQEIIQAEKILLKESGKKPTLFAPAYGEIDARISGVCDRLGYQVIMWSLDTIDWQKPDVATIVKRVVPRIHNDAIILMHPTDPTVQSLPEIITRLKADGYKIVPVSQLIQPEEKSN
ncbi:MAG: polysaccharide deacetylase family protein [Syntrophomonadaceae bacterium]|nr:polysaccharide deacetylase family protein [Syntrophomonadaceae bacterium]